ncbi:hypothetical protein [Burkholderia stagnalis]|uniref:hypothetical protein n=1 Tax=Burkholderia stagnalis TaxID=1503054 RepID=UPI000F801644|nr:hypothetical protein [Burkholderia stagnalis]
MNYAYRRLAGWRAGRCTRHAVAVHRKFDQDSDRLQWRRMPFPVIAEWKRAAMAMADSHPGRPENSIENARFSPVIFTGLSARGRMNFRPVHGSAARNGEHEPVRHFKKSNENGLSDTL